MKHEELTKLARLLWADVDVEIHEAPGHGYAAVVVVGEARVGLVQIWHPHAEAGLRACLRAMLSEGES